MRRLRSISFVLLGLLLSVPSQSLVADAFSERRAQVGIKLFRTLLAAELNASASESPVYFVYANDRNQAEKYAQQFTDGVPDNAARDTETVALSSLLKGQQRPAGALFVSQRLNADELEALVDYAASQKIISFSPYEGDVEAGVLGGLSVEATIKPFINMNTLTASGINIKDFYIRVAKQYE